MIVANVAEINADIANEHLILGLWFLFSFKLEHLSYFCD